MSKEVLNDTISIDEYINGDKKGVIELQCPLVNITEWYGTNPSVYSILLGIPESEIEKVVYFVQYVLEKDYGDYRKGDRITTKEYEKLKRDDAAFPALAGAAGFEVMVSCVDLKKKMEESRKTEREMMEKINAICNEHETDAIENDEALFDEWRGASKELDKARTMIDAVVYMLKKKDDLIIKNIDVVPLELKNKIKMYAKFSPYAIYDIERLYNDIILKNKRIERLIKMGAPEVIIRNEERMLQEAVDTLLANGRRGKPVLRNHKAKNSPRTSLSDIAVKSLKLF